MPIYANLNLIVYTINLTAYRDSRNLLDNKGLGYGRVYKKVESR